MECGSDADLAGHIDVATALLDEAVDHGQAETGTFSYFFGGEERLEDFGLGFRVHADAVVNDREENVGAGFDWVGILLDRKLGHVVISGLDGNTAAIGEGIARVYDQIDDGLLKLGLVGTDPSDVGIELGLDQNVFADQALQHLFGVEDDAADVEDLWFEHLLTAEGEELSCERRSLSPGLQDLVDVPAKGGAIRERLSQNVGVADNDAQQVIEVVRDAAGKTSHCLHLLRLQ